MRPHLSQRGHHIPPRADCLLPRATESLSTIMLHVDLRPHLLQSLSVRNPQQLMVSGVAFVRTRHGTQDNVTQPFEDVLPYERFSVRVLEADIGRLPDILAGISESKRRDMRAEAACAWRAMVWSSVHGSFTGADDDTTDAMAVLIHTLRGRLGLDGAVGNQVRMCGFGRRAGGRLLLFLQFKRAGGWMQMHGLIISDTPLATFSRVYVRCLTEHDATCSCHHCRRPPLSPTDSSSNGCGIGGVCT
jgi:hypothetical protein